MDCRLNTKTVLFTLDFDRLGLARSYGACCALSYSRSPLRVLAPRTPHPAPLSLLHLQLLSHQRPLDQVIGRLLAPDT